MNTIKAPTQFGLPAYNEMLDCVLQGYDDTCAVKSQEIILNAAGIPVNEETLRLEAYQQGWYRPGSGTPMEDVGKLMEMHGLEVSRQTHGSIYHLVNETSQGHPVIVGVDSGELWLPGSDESFEDIIRGPIADHALIVGGITFQDDFSGGSVSLIDPGTGDFGKEYDLDVFLDAWADSDNFMVTIK